MIVEEQYESPEVLTASKASFFTVAEADVAGTLVATDYKDPPLIAYDLENSPTEEFSI